ncbi:MAG: hypothetical protein QXO70_03745 [Candidatus Pacearchaeota archaeon]
MVRLTLNIEAINKLNFLNAQWKFEPIYKSYEEFKKELERITSIEDDSSRIKQINLFWKEMLNKKQIPFRFNDKVAFLYKGNYDSVYWNGDFNSWGKSKSIDNKGKRVNNSDIWILEYSFPPDARIDYKIVRDTIDK